LRKQSTRQGEIGQVMEVDAQFVKAFLDIGWILIRDRSADSSSILISRCTLEWAGEGEPREPEKLRLLRRR